MPAFLKSSLIQINPAQLCPTNSDCSPSLNRFAWSTQGYPRLDCPRDFSGQIRSRAMLAIIDWANYVPSQFDHSRLALSHVQLVQCYSGHRFNIQDHPPGLEIFTCTWDLPSDLNDPHCLAHYLKYNLSAGKHYNIFRNELEDSFLQHWRWLQWRGSKMQAWDYSCWCISAWGSTRKTCCDRGFNYLPKIVIAGFPVDHQKNSKSINILAVYVTPRMCIRS